MDSLALAARDPVAVLAERGRRGPLGIAFSSSVPLEVLDAFGLEAAWLPVLPADSTPRADGLMQAFTCTYTRAAAELALAASLPVGLVAHASGCDAQTALQGILLGSLGMVSLKLPIAVAGPSATRQARGALREMIAAAAALLGREPDAAVLSEACALRGKVRARVTEAFGSVAAGRMPAVRAYETAVASQVMAPAAFLDAAAAPAPGHAASPEGRVRVLVSGAHVPSVRAIEGIESVGAAVVLDDTETGTRGASRRVRADAPDILDAIADSLVDGMVHGPVRVLPGRSRIDRLIEAASDAEVAAAVLLHHRCCDPHAFEAPALTDALREAEIPSVLIEIDRDSSLSARDLARVQALVESIA
jgi:benzoyl-CoA reductase/2-hydroxyglutaryl-CoA dehydratase subunit BcrC/BadD/HgdB